MWYLDLDASEHEVCLGFFQFDGEIDCIRHSNRTDCRPPPCLASVLEQLVLLNQAPAACLPWSFLSSIQPAGGGWTHMHLMCHRARLVSACVRCDKLSLQRQSWGRCLPLRWPGQTPELDPTPSAALPSRPKRRKRTKNEIPPTATSL